LPTRVFNALALDPVEGSLMALPLGGLAEMGIVRIRMSSSYPGIGEMKLSKAYIEAIKT
jgi:hypothetical protein